MKMILTQPVEIALRSLGEEDRQRVTAWLDHLKNWDQDDFVQEQSHKLDSFENVYVLKTNTDFRIFYRVKKDTIVVLDIATRSTLLLFGNTKPRDLLSRSSRV